MSNIIYRFAYIAQPTSDDIIIFVVKPCTIVPVVKSIPPIKNIIISSSIANKTNNTFKADLNHTTPKTAETHNPPVYTTANIIAIQTITPVLPGYIISIPNLADFTRVLIVFISNTIQYVLNINAYIPVKMSSKCLFFFISIATSQYTKVIVYIIISQNGQFVNRPNCDKA